MNNKKENTMIIKTNNEGASIKNEGSIQAKPITETHNKTFIRQQNVKLNTIHRELVIV